MGISPNYIYAKAIIISRHNYRGDLIHCYILLFAHEECCPPHHHGLAMPSGVLYINAVFTATCTHHTSGGFLAASKESLHPHGDIRTAVHSCSHSYTRSNACFSTGIYLSHWALFLHPRPFKSSFVTWLRVLVCMKWERWEQGSDGW